MPGDGHSYQFTHALIRIPAMSVAEGLRAVDQGAPDAIRFRADHRVYIAALERAGVAVTVLEPLEEFPDSVFIEDTALCLPEGAVILKPGAPSREGETTSVRAALTEFYDDIRHLDGNGHDDGHVEGGDILVTGREILVGLSERTDAAGIEALSGIVGDWNYTLRRADVPADVLHFKTDCGLLDGETILATRRLSASGCLDGYRVVEVPDGEEAAANAIRINGKVLLSAGFPRTAEMLSKADYDLDLVPTGQAALIDGGPSCQSLRFTPQLP